MIRYQLTYQPTQDAVAAATPWIDIAYMTLVVNATESITDDRRQALETRLLMVPRDWRLVSLIELPQETKA
jgi:hypothetical protein